MGYNLSSRRDDYDQYESLPEWAQKTLARHARDRRPYVYSLDELAQVTGRAKSNLSRTLKTMAGYGLVRLERGERGRVAPKVIYDRVELDLPLTGS